MFKSIQSVFLDSIKLWENNILNLFRINLLFFALLILINYFSALIAIQLSYVRTVQNFLLSIIVTPSFAYLFNGYIYFHIKKCRGASSSTTQLLRGYKGYFDSLLYYLFIIFLFFIFIVPLKQVNQYEGVMQLRLYGGAILAIYIFNRSIFSLLFILDYNQKFSEAVKSSFAITDNKNFQVLLIIIFSTIILFSGFFIFIVGILLTASPAMMVIILKFIRYEKLNYLGN
jgi:hypothetical protein